MWIATDRQIDRPTDQPTVSRQQAIRKMSLELRPPCNSRCDTMQIRPNSKTIKIIYMYPDQLLYPFIGNGDVNSQQTNHNNIFFKMQNA